jgi:hypothetical protein
MSNLLTTVINMSLPTMLSYSIPSTNESTFILTMSLIELSKGIETELHFNMLYSSNKPWKNFP